MEALEYIRLEESLAEAERKPGVSLCFFGRHGASDDFALSDLGYELLVYKCSISMCKPKFHFRGSCITAQYYLGDIRANSVSQ